ncbi:VanZ family protein [Microbacterium memoriense]|uniref:VanZ family protein n=1 Tax=Microbacterium memoriense TaxID=2978350 RepID=A0ABT2PBI4_9MICO|nr:VanZ family protein [Microbacterium memoriense]MCT9001931.1 VanZ family protein [Microbacterium memoriense]
MTDAPSPPLHIPPRPPLPALSSPRSLSETPRAESKRRNTRDPRAYLLAYTLLLTGIAFWPVPVDQGAGPLLRLITRAIPALTYERIEFAANILLFVPLGLLLTLILVRNRWLVLPVAFLATVTIECVQALLLDARTPSVLDIVANTAGACIGILIAVFIDALRASYRPRRLDEDSLIHES